MQQKEIKCDNHLKTQVKTTVTKFSTEYALMERLPEMIGQLGIIHSDKNLFAMFDSMVRYINEKMRLPQDAGAIVSMYLAVEQRQI